MRQRCDRDGAGEHARSSTSRSRPVPLDSLGEGLARLTLESGAAPVRWADLRIAWPAPAEADRPGRLARGAYDVLVVLFDSLRADHLEPYQAAAGTTPVAARLAAEGVTFVQARAPSSWTRPSVASLLTSVSPATHGISTLRDGLPPETPYLAEILAAAGYHTVALTHSGQLAPELGFGRGFATLERFYAPRLHREYFALPSPEARAEFVWQRGLAPDLEAAGERPWFVYLHERDPHDPYEPPAPYDERFMAGIDPDPQAPTGPARYMREPLREEDVARLGALYRGEVSFMDRFLGAPLERLRTAQGDRKTFVVFVSDHGESFGEHGLLGHALAVYEELLHVPMIWWCPGVLPAGLRVEEPVGLVDVSPTLLDLLGLEAPAAMQGRSLLPAMRAGPRRSAARSFLAEGLAGHQTALRHGRWKLVRHSANAYATAGAANLAQIEDLDPATADFEYQLFDLERDPAELHDLYEERPHVAAAMGQLLAWELHRLGSSRPGAQAGPAPALGSDTIEDLKALGYVE